MNMFMNGIVGEYVINKQQVTDIGLNTVILCNGFNLSQWP